MPQLNTLVLTDGAPTPVNHTFNPRGIDQGVATLVQSTGVPIGDKRLTFSQNRSNSGRVRAIMKLTIPTVQDATVNGVTRPTLVRTAYADITFNFDATSSSEERRDIVALVRSTLDPTKTMVKGTLVDLEGIF